MRMLLAVDLVDGAADAVDAVVPWADRLDAVVDLVHVNPHLTPVTGHSVELTQLLEAAWARLEADRRERLRALLGRLPLERRGDAFAEVDASPAQGVLRDAARADLVVVLTHGRTGAARLWMGSVAERVVRLSHVPVLVLRYGASPASLPARPRLVVGVDPADAEGVSAAAIRWGQRLSGVVDLAWVQPELPMGTSREEGSLVPAWDRVREHQRVALSARFEQLPAEIRGAAVVLRGDAPEELCRLARHADLVVVSTHGRTGLDRWWNGSVAERVARLSPVPVLVEPSC